MSKKTRRLEPPTRLFFGLSLFLGILFASCNVTRTVTTTSQYWQKGDTTCTIQTKTIEQYDATKKL